MRAEMRARALRAVRGGVLVAGAALLALVGLNTLATAATHALAARGLDMGWAALAVAGGILALAMIFGAIGWHLLKSTSLAPRDTIKTLETDAAILKETFRDR